MNTPGPRVGSRPPNSPGSFKTIRSFQPTSTLVYFYVYSTYIFQIRASCEFDRFVECEGIFVHGEDTWPCFRKGYSSMDKYVPTFLKGYFVHDGRILDPCLACFGQDIRPRTNVCLAFSRGCSFVDECLPHKSNTKPTTTSTRTYSYSFSCGVWKVANAVTSRFRKHQVDSLPKVKCNARL